MKTGVSYLRKSNEEQSNFSISGQEIINNEWARLNGIKIVATYVDDGYSAKDFNRPDWQRLVKDLPGLNVDYLIVMKYDRLIRNLIGGLTFVEKMEAQWNVTLLSVQENYAIDIHDPYFFKIRADIFVDAEFELRRISDRTKMGIWSGKTQGRFLGCAPYGYNNARDENDKPIIIVDDEKRSVIKFIFAQYVKDVPLAHIMKEARLKGFKQSAKQAIKRVLLQPAYAGLIKVKAYKKSPEQIVKGIHEPIISEDLYWEAYYKIQEKERPYKIKLQDDNLPLRGFIYCQHCNKPFTGSKVKGKNAYFYYYWCNDCRGTNYNTKKVDADMSVILKGLSLNENLIRMLIAESKDQAKESLVNKKERIGILNREKVAINTKLDNIEEKYFSDKITDDVYQKWHRQFRSELNDISSKSERLNGDHTLYVERFEKYFPYLSDLEYLYHAANVGLKQEFLKRIFPGGLVALNKGYKTPFLPHLFAHNYSKVNGLLEVGCNSDDGKLGVYDQGCSGGSETTTRTPLSPVLPDDKSLGFNELSSVGQVPQYALSDKSNIGVRGDTKHEHLLTVVSQILRAA